MPTVVSGRKAATKSAIQDAFNKREVWDIVTWDRKILKPEYHGRDVIDIADRPEQLKNFEVLGRKMEGRLVLRYALLVWVRCHQAKM